MKKELSFLIFLIFIGFSLSAQDLQLSTVLLSSAGGSESGKEINISKWRLGLVHRIIFEDEVDPEIRVSEINVFPNPVINDLNIKFNVATEGKYSFEIYDLSGRKLVIKNPQKIFPADIITIDVSGLTSGIYLLNIIDSQSSDKRVSKFSKQ